MERDDQIFIRIDPDQEPIEYLLAEQPRGMIRGQFATKEEIRQVVETGSSYEEEEYTKLYIYPEFHVMVTIWVQLDHTLRMVLKIEKSII